MQIIVFCVTARLTQFYAEFMAAMGTPVLEIHSRKSQPARTKASDAFRAGSRVRLLIQCIAFWCMSDAGGSARASSMLCMHPQCTSLLLLGKHGGLKHSCCIFVQSHCIPTAMYVPAQVIMFTSDVSARGVDYPDVSLVIQVGVAAQCVCLIRVHASLSLGCEALQSKLCVLVPACTCVHTCNIAEASAKALSASAKCRVSIPQSLASGLSTDTDAFPLSRWACRQTGRSTSTAWVALPVPESRWECSQASPQPDASPSEGVCKRNLSARPHRLPHLDSHLLLTLCVRPVT